MIPGGRASVRAECECRLGRSLALPRTRSPILMITQGHLACLSRLARRRWPGPAVKAGPGFCSGRSTHTLSSGGGKTRCAPVSFGSAELVSFALSARNVEGDHGRCITHRADPEGRGDARIQSNCDGKHRGADGRGSIDSPEPGGQAQGPCATPAPSRSGTASP